LVDVTAALNDFFTLAAIIKCHRQLEGKFIPIDLDLGDKKEETAAKHISLARRRAGEVKLVFVSIKFTICRTNRLLSTIDR